MRSLLKDSGVVALVAAGSLSLLVACSGEEKKPPATAATPPPAAGAHASGEMPVVTTTPPSSPSPPPVVVQQDVRERCDLPDQRESGLPFAYDVSELTDSDKEMLSALATCLGHGGLAGEAIRIVGHADPRGSDQYNMDLGMKRAVSVRAYLLERGVPPGSIVVKSEGERQASGDSEHGWALDRRVEIEVATPQSSAAPEEAPAPAPDNPYE